MRSGEVFATARRRRPIAGIADGAAAAAIGISAACRGRTIGALVAHRSRAATSREPRFAAGDLPALPRGARAWSDRARERAARAARRSAVGHRRPDAALQLALPEPGAAPRNQARVAKRPAAVAAVHRSRRLQGDQRHARPPVRQPRAGRGGGRHPRAAPARPTWSRGSAATSSR